MVGSVSNVFDPGWAREMEFEFTPQYEAHPYEVRYRPEERGYMGKMTRWQK